MCNLNALYDGRVCVSGGTHDGTGLTAVSSFLLREQSVSHVVRLTDN